jgi:hypothetical protein
MSQFRTIIEAVLRNSAGGELDRIELRRNPRSDGSMCLPVSWATQELEVGDTITIEEREEEVE